MQIPVAAPGEKKKAWDPLAMVGPVPVLKPPPAPDFDEDYEEYQPPPPPPPPGAVVPPRPPPMFVDDDGNELLYDDNDDGPAPPPPEFDDDDGPAPPPPDEDHPQPLPSGPIDLHSWLNDINPQLLQGEELMRQHAFYDELTLPLLTMVIR